MLTKEEAKENVKKIVDDFLSIPKYDLDKKPEEQIKFQFIEPLLEALGWGKKDIEKEEKSEKAPFNKYEYELTLQQKITILTRCIHGVDLDEKAVELARLNLIRY